MAKNVVVYSAVFGGYDSIVPPRHPNPNVHYVMFTDSRQNIKGWNVRQVEPKYSPRKTSRYYKVLAHQHFPDAEYTIWFGGWLIPTGDPLPALKYLGKHDIAMEPHLERNCLYKEAMKCIEIGKVNEGNARRQMKAYKQDGFPANYGLTSAFFIVRRNTPNIAALENLWWEQINTYTTRDQLSLMYCMWKLGEDYGRIPIGPRAHGHYRTKAHIGGK